MTTGKDLDAWMWAHACELLGQADRMHRQFFRPGVPGPRAVAWEPPVDMFEDEREIVIVVAMPGVPASRVQVTHDAGELLVRGSRSLPLSDGEHRVHQLEIPYGVFERRIALPPGRFEASRPEMADGCLVLRLFKL